MYCKKCSGVVFHDSMYENESFIDLACMMCGRRWFVKKGTAMERYVLNAKKS